MARICVYNSAASVDTAGNSITHTLTTDANTPRLTKPVRLFTAEGEIRYISYEFIYTGATATSVLDLRWYQMFYGDSPGLVTVPTAGVRVSAGLNVALPWARERDEVVGTGGAITHSNILRTLSLTIPSAGPGNAIGLAVWINGLAVHALWTCLAVYAGAAVPSDSKLEIYAYVGGHLEEKYLEDNGAVPYAYNA